MNVAVSFDLDIAINNQSKADISIKLNTPTRWQLNKPLYIIGGAVQRVRQKCENECSVDPVNKQAYKILENYLKTIRVFI